MKRRDFLRQAAAAAVSAGAVSAAGPRELRRRRPPAAEAIPRVACRPGRASHQAGRRGFLPERGCRQRPVGPFDPELGYVLRDSIMRDGVDGSSTIARYSPTGERKLVNFADRTCRINTYGDSFTQCHQVSDGETWQEHRRPTWASRSAISALAATACFRPTGGCGGSSRPRQNAVSGAEHLG